MIVSTLEIEEGCHGSAVADIDGQGCDAPSPRYMRLPYLSFACGANSHESCACGHLSDVRILHDHGICLQLSISVLRLGRALMPLIAHGSWRTLLSLLVISPFRVSDCLPPLCLTSRKIKAFFGRVGSVSRERSSSINLDVPCHVCLFFPCGTADASLRWQLRVIISTASYRSWSSRPQSGSSSIPIAATATATTPYPVLAACSASAGRPVSSSQGSAPRSTAEPPDLTARHPPAAIRRFSRERIGGARIPVRKRLSVPHPLSSPPHLLHLLSRADFSPHPLYTCPCVTHSIGMRNLHLIHRIRASVRPCSTPLNTSLTFAGNLLFIRAVVAQDALMRSYCK